jgi:hypothetical protein
MRLSMSGEHTGNEYGLEAAIGNDASGGGLPDGDLLSEYAEAICAHDEERAAKGRAEIVAKLGEVALVDIAGVIAAFNGYPRAADATGIPLEDYKEEATEKMRGELGLDSLNHCKTA